MLIGNLYCYRNAPQVGSCYGVRYNYIPRYACSPYSSHVAGVRCMGKYTRVCKVIQEYAIVCKSMQGYASSPHSSHVAGVRCISKYTRVCISMHASQDSCHSHSVSCLSLVPMQAVMHGRIRALFHYFWQNLSLKTDSPTENMQPNLDNEYSAFPKKLVWNFVVCFTHKLASFPGSPGTWICIAWRAWYLSYVSMT